jgi:uncharacterized protein YndB with AHSA1/START domain
MQILHDFPIRAPREAVFRAISTPQGLDSWWTQESSGNPELHAESELWFGPDYHWKAKVVGYEPDSLFELQMVLADSDWMNSRIRIQLETRGDFTWVQFSHSGWPEQNEHYRISNCCWAMYLRVLRRSLEFGEVVAYDDRLNV